MYIIITVNLLTTYVLLVLRSKIYKFCKTEGLLAAYSIALAVIIHSLSISHHILL